MKIHVIYIPGLGDKYDSLRRLLLRLWRYKGLGVEHVPMRWETDEPLEDKYARVEAAIQSASDKQIFLLGESAGGSITMAMYERHYAQLAGAMTICGKNQGARNVSAYLYRRNPAFRHAMEGADESVERLPDAARRKFVSIHPRYDPVVPVHETLLHGCSEIVLQSVGHFVPIIQALTVSSYRLVRMMRDVSRNM